MRWGEVDDLFGRALARPESERAAFVARESAGDPGLAAAVSRLLDAVAESDAFWREVGRQRSLAWREAFGDADPPRRSR